MKQTHVRECWTFILLFKEHRLDSENLIKAQTAFSLIIHSLIGGNAQCSDSSVYLRFSCAALNQDKKQLDMKENKKVI